LRITSALSDVFSSEVGEAEANHSRDPRRKNMGERSATSEPLNACYTRRAI